MEFKLFMENGRIHNKSNIVILGASGHGKVVADIARLNGYEQIVFLDDDTSKQNNGEYPVVGTISDFLRLHTVGNIHKSDYDVFVAIGNNSIRKQISEQLPVQPVTLIHPAAVIDRTAIIGCGSVVMAGAIVNADARIGNGCIINTGASVDHDCVLGDHVHISPGVHIAGTANIGEKTWFGVGSCCVNNVNIAADCVVGAGAVAIDDITESGIYVGCPAVRVR